MLKKQVKEVVQKKSSPDAVEAQKRILPGATAEQKAPELSIDRPTVMQGILKERIGFDSMAAASQIVAGLSMLISGVPDGEKTSAATALLHGLRPGSAQEGLLFAQMIAIHQTLLTTAYRMKQASEPAEVSAHANALAKLGRLALDQQQTLLVMRGRQVPQKVTVGQVNVSEGGQAVVGNVQRTHAPEAGETAP